ncbi:hypothetical protein [Cellulomonas iranensis]|uniref:hypothetical protein n=1 Tax=Cellulomonas iranensis TaxID=76862 RepID=UPI003D7DEE1C
MIDDDDIKFLRSVLYRKGARLLVNMAGLAREARTDGDLIARVVAHDSGTVVVYYREASHLLINYIALNAAIRAIDVPDEHQWIEDGDRRLHDIRLGNRLPELARLLEAQEEN